MHLKNIRTIRLDGGDPEQKRQEILDYFHASFAELTVWELL